MTYTKPEVGVLGDAAGIIQFRSKPYGSTLDFLSTRNAFPAYDLDE
jgi:hypothetical protein